MARLAEVITKEALTTGTTDGGESFLFFFLTKLNNFKQRDFNYQLFMPQKTLYSNVVVK